MPKPTRREFIKTGAGAIGAGLALPVINRAAEGTTIVKRLKEDLAGNGNILVIVELAGGNDGLNTIVPLQQYDTYASLRARIKHDKDKVLPLYGTTTMGLSPNLEAIKPIADAGKMAVIQAAHYPTPNLSHESSRYIYYRGTPNPSVSTFNSTGWIGRDSSLFGNKENSLDTIGVGSVNPTLYALGAKVSGINATADGSPSGYQFNTDGRFAGDRANQLAAARIMDTGVGPPYADLVETTELDAFDSADRVAEANRTYQSSVVYPAQNNFAAGLKLIAKLATASPTLGTRVFHISTGGFDTHANQIVDQQRLHQNVSAGLKAFYDDLVAHNIQDRVVVMIWTEFGRRVADNASNGTDHGTANDMIIIGDRVKGGTYGADPNLTDLERGNLKWKIDFRAVYQTILESWLGRSSADVGQVLGGDFGNLGFIA